MQFLPLLLILLAACSAPLPRHVEPGCGCKELESDDYFPCEEEVSVVPCVDPCSPLPDPSWGHDNAGDFGTWIPLKSVGEGDSQGFIKDIDIHAFSAVIIPYALELERTKRMRFEDTKIYQKDDGEGVRWIRLILSSQAILDLCESRELLVDIVEGLLERLNKDPVILASFAHQPITASDLEIYLSFESFYVEYDNPTFIAWVSLLDGDVRIFDGVLKDFRKDYWNSRVESYVRSRDYVMITRKARDELDKKYPMKRKRFSWLYNLD